MKQNKVATNLQQDFTEAEKAQARENIGAGTGNGTAKLYKKDLNGNVFDASSLTIGPDRYVTLDTTLAGSLVPLPDFETDEGKVPVVYYRNNRKYYLLERLNTVPSTAGSSDYKKVLTVDSHGAYDWELPEEPAEYEAGDGINFSTHLGTGNTVINWDYTVGRNLHINQNDQIQTNFPGGVWDAPTTMSNNFTAITGSDFAGAFRLGCKYYGDKYQLAIIYTASSTTANIQFIGTETVIGTDNSCTVNQAVYNETALYTPVYRFGYSTSTVFDPSVHKAIIYNGIGLIGPCSDCKIAIWNDNGTVKIGMTAIEVGKVGSTL